MVYTDFFVRGTQPNDVCPLHSAPSLLDRLAGVFGAGDDRRPVSAEEIGVAAPTPTRTTGAAPAVKAKPSTAKPDAKVEEKKEDEEPKKKRGFWSRLFGRGGDDDKDDKKKEEEKKQQEKKKPGGGG
jgi:hypothetical protein